MSRQICSFCRSATRVCSELQRLSCVVSRYDRHSGTRPAEDSQVRSQGRPTELSGSDENGS